MSESKYDGRYPEPPYIELSHDHENCELCARLAKLCAHLERQAAENEAAIRDVESLAAQAYGHIRDRNYGLANEMVEQILRATRKAAIARAIARADQGAKG